MDSRIKKIIKNEYERQRNTLGLIPSENFSSKAVREAVGSVLMHKYSEGYPHKRYYEGNEEIDRLEDLARVQVKKVFGVGDDWHVNVQTLSGSTANLAVYNSVLEKGDKIMSMYLPDGGHLSHGWSYSKDKSLDSDDSLISRGGEVKVSIVSKIYNVVQYKTNPETNLFDYSEIEKIAKDEKPKLIVTGGTAYPREIDYKKMREIADSVGAYYLADVAHEAGLIAGDAMSSPFKYADFVTFTTHKTLRGPRGAVAMCRSEFADRLDRSVFPGMQGGPFNHNIAGILQAFFEAETEEFKDYAKQVVKNAECMAGEFVKKGYHVITGGTDKHLVLLDVSRLGISGKFASASLAQVGIITNMNTVPWDTRTPFNPSGLRIGTPILTTRGMKESEMLQVVDLIDRTLNVALKHSGSLDDQKLSSLDSFLSNFTIDSLLQEISNEVGVLCDKFSKIFEE